MTNAKGYGGKPEEGYLFTIIGSPLAGRKMQMQLSISAIIICPRTPAITHNQRTIVGPAQPSFIDWEMQGKACKERK